MEQIRVLGATMLAVVSALVSAMTLSTAWAVEASNDATLTLVSRQVTDWLTLDGTVSAIHQGTVAAQTSGRVSRML
ncbi:TPA: efflux RND transporter periplasmic adaptor subunit, partial [Aeromonas hydrophila]